MIRRVKNNKNHRMTVEAYACACELKACPCGSVCTCNAWCSGDSAGFYDSRTGLHNMAGNLSDSRLDDVTFNRQLKPNTQLN